MACRVTMQSIPKEIVRCRLNSLDPDERWKVGHHELKMLRAQKARDELSESIFEVRRRAIVDFMSGVSNRIVSDGVYIEFFVGDSDG